VGGEGRTNVLSLSEGWPYSFQYIPPRYKKKAALTPLVITAALYSVNEPIKVNGGGYLAHESGVEEQRSTGTVLIYCISMRSSGSGTVTTDPYNSDIHQ
jgi:hypothetical protein